MLKQQKAEIDNVKKIKQDLKSHMKTYKDEQDKKRAEKDARRAASMGAEQPLRLTANPYATLSEEEG